MSNTYRLSDGSRISKSTIDSRIRKAKQDKIDQMIIEYGYIFCEDCGKNANSGEPIDCSHDISVDECQKSGRSELSYCVQNIKMRCRTCHRIHDKTN